jgi:hypothetical protein
MGDDPIPSCKDQVSSLGSSALTDHILPFNPQITGLQIN